MKRSIIYIVCLMVAGWVSIQAQDLPSMTTLKNMLQANRNFLENRPDSGTIHANTWNHSVYYEGLMALYGVNPNQMLADQALRWGAFHKWNMPGGVGTRVPENQCCGQTYIDLYILDRYKEERIKQIRASIDNMIASDKIDDWNSASALHMSMPVLARLGKVYNDETYYDRMYEMYMFTKTKLWDNGLYNPEDNLWLGGRDSEAGDYGSVENGWALAALVRTLEFSPNSAKYRKEYESTLREMFESLLSRQREDGFWNASLKDQSNTGNRELTGTYLFVYGMAWGINNGVINKKDYLPAVTKAWDSIQKYCLKPDGSLYIDNGPGSEDVNMGCFLLAGSEMYKLLKSLEPKEKEKREKEDKKRKT